MTENIDFEDFLFGSDAKQDDKGGDGDASTGNATAEADAVTVKNDDGNGADVTTSVDENINNVENLDISTDTTIDTDDIVANEDNNAAVDSNVESDDTTEVENTPPTTNTNTDAKDDDTNFGIMDDLEAQILQDLENLPQFDTAEEPQKYTIEQLAQMNGGNAAAQNTEGNSEEKKEEEAKEEENKQEEEEEEPEPEDEKSIIEKKRQEILSKIEHNNAEGTEEIDENETEGGVKKIEDLNLEDIDYKEFEKINEEHIDLYYLLNDTKDNPEFLDEDLLAQSKKEDEARELKNQARQEMDFELEELVDDDKVKVDLTDILKDIEKIKEEKKHES